MASDPIQIPEASPKDTSDSPLLELPSSVSYKLSGLHEWLSLENKRVRHWWSSKSTDVSKAAANQSHATDELRAQLNEQLRALDGRVDNQCGLVVELQDWFRRRAELHQEYSVKLEKLSKSLMARHREQKVKRENWNLFSVYNCWQILVNQTKRDARDHSAMADVYFNNIVPRFTQIQDDIQRIYKKCRDICYESHEELLKVLHELHTAMRTYHMYQSEFKNAEIKLQNLESQKSKLEQTNSREKLEKRKKFKVIEKEIEKRRSKYRDAKLKALKARNDYILSMDSANASIQKYFVEDLSDIIDCMDFGFHSSIAKAFMTHISGQDCFKRSLVNNVDDLNKSKINMDSRHDKQRFLEFNNAAFMLPKKFDFQGYKGDEINQVLVTYPIQEEMEKRYARLVSRLTNLKAESEENWKTIETAEKTLLTMINTRDYDIAHYFSEEPRSDLKTPEAVVFKRKADHIETESFYLSKFREYTVGGNLICRLQARFELMRKSLGDENQIISSPTPSRVDERSLVVKPRRRRIGRTPLMGQPRLFGGSLEEYLEATGQEIPLIIRSCIRIINLYGLHHQGIFRVSGSQVEIINFRESFEKMEDPLADVSDASDINSIAGVLKLYLRELREPLFPTVFFEQFMEIAQLESKNDFVNKVQEVVMSLPRSVFVVMRYLFAFLNHLSEFSDENMMDPYNLAICFGPTLVPIPEDKDQVQYQNLVNELIKNIIIFCEDIFPCDGGPVYEKYISRECLDLEAEVGDAPTEDTYVAGFELEHSEDENEIIEAVAQFDFSARSERELSFCKGDVLLLQAQISSDWWRGSFKGKVGLIPDKYILLKIRDEDKEKIMLERSLSTSCEDSKQRLSSSSESVPTPSSQPSDPGGVMTPNGGSPGRLIQCSLQSEWNPSSNVSEQLDFERNSPVSSLTSMESSLGISESSVISDATSQPLQSSQPRTVGTPQLQEENEERVITQCTEEEGCSINKDLSFLSYDNTSSLPSSGFSSMSSSSKVKLSDTIRMCSSLTESSTGHVDCSGSVTENWHVTIRPFSQGSLPCCTSTEDRELILGTKHCSKERPMTKNVNKAVSGAPDLVMDLPVSSLSSSPKNQTHVETSSNSINAMQIQLEDSFLPHRSSFTTAEYFAKQNQNTLKKGSASLKASASTDAQTQTAVNVSAGSMIKDNSGVTKGTNEIVPSVSTIVKNLDTVMQQIKAEQQQHQQHAETSDDISVEVRAAADMIPTDIATSPSTPKLAARYLKAVAASGGGGACVALKPQARVKPSVMRKPSLPPQLSLQSTVLSDKENK